MIDVSIRESSIPRNRCPWACASGRAVLFDSAYGKGIPETFNKKHIRHADNAETTVLPIDRFTGPRGAAVDLSLYFWRSQRGWPVARRTE